MDINKLIHDINTINWHIYTGEHYQPERVPTSLIALVLADKESKEGISQREGGDDADLLLNAKISSDVMFAIGNEHRGTYYPAVREALPFIFQIAFNGPHIVARNCAINIMINLYYFCPQCDSEELENFVKDSIKTVINENKSYFYQLIVDDYRHVSLVGSVMSIIDDYPGSDCKAEKEYYKFINTISCDTDENMN